MSTTVGTTAATPVAVATPTDRPYVDWSPVVAGAVAATAISFVLMTFGAAIGLSLTSPWPETGARLWVIALAVAWWGILVHIGSFAAGGYLAGRMRRPFADAALDERQFRDSAHGFLVWALGVLLGGVILAWSTGTIVQGAAQTNGMTATTQADATRPADHAVDLLLRPNVQGAKPAASPQAGTDESAIRAEAARIFRTTIQNQAFAARDREYLTGVLQQRLGLDQAEAQGRVDAAMTEARDREVEVRQQLETARRATVIGGFIIAATLLLGCVAACFAAAAGGRHRDEARVPEFYGTRFW